MNKIALYIMNKCTIIFLFEYQRLYFSIILYYKKNCFSVIQFRFMIKIININFETRNSVNPYS